MFRSLLCLPVILQAGCSNQQMYESLRRDQWQKCQILPDSEFQRCMARTGQSFEDYWRDREDALNRDKGAP